MTQTDVEIRVQEQYNSVWTWQVRVGPGDDEDAWRNVAQVHLFYGNDPMVTPCNPSPYGTGSLYQDENILFMRAMAEVYPLAIAKYEQLRRGGVATPASSEG